MVKTIGITLIGLTLAILPLEVSAVAYVNPGTGFGFGGWVSYFVPCTCPPGPLWIFFTPLYLSGAPAPIIGPMIYIPLITDLYPRYAIATPTTWELGDYTPGAQACLIGVPPACVPLPATGVMTRVGISDPGFPPISF